MLRALTILMVMSLYSCARSDALSSDRINCLDGVKVFTRGGVHCAYVDMYAPDEAACPDGVNTRYSFEDVVICSSDSELSPEWLRAIYLEAWPPLLDASVDSEERPVSDASVSSNESDMTVQVEDVVDGTVLNDL